MTTTTMMMINNEGNSNHAIVLAVLKQSPTDQYRVQDASHPLSSGSSFQSSASKMTCCTPCWPNLSVSDVEMS